MNKIEETLNKYTGCKGTCECGCGLVEVIKELGELAFEAGRESTSPLNKEGFVYETYEDYLKEIEDETRN